MRQKKKQLGLNTKQAKQCHTNYESVVFQNLRKYSTLIYRFLLTSIKSLSYSPNKWREVIYKHVHPLSNTVDLFQRSTNKQLLTPQNITYPECFILTMIVIERRRFHRKKNALSDDDPFRVFIQAEDTPLNV
jgi:hypothetical protein